MLPTLPIYLYLLRVFNKDVPFELKLTLNQANHLKF